MSTAKRSYGVYQPRSRAGAIGDAMANLRDGAMHLLHDTLLRFVGMMMLAFVILALLALASFDAGDPSLNEATGRAANNWLGQPGAFGADLMLEAFGVGVLALILPLGVWGWRFATGGSIEKFRWRLIALVLGTIFLAAAFGGLPSVGQLPAGAGGVLGQIAFVFNGKVASAFALPWLAYVIPAIFASFGLTLAWIAAGIQLEFAFRAMKKVAVFSARSGRAIAAIPFWRPRARFAAEDHDEFEEADEDADDSMFGISPEPLTPRDMSRTGRVQRADEKKRKAKPKSDRQPALNLAAGEYQLPPLGFLNEPPVEITAPTFSDDALEENARLLETVLTDFGVRGRIVAVRPGPVVTLYELEPAAGVKSSRVVSLSDDIARSMSAVAARVAVIPGRNVIGIELPNGKRETVYLRELLAAPEYEKSRAPLTLALGKTIGGEPVMADLAKMPHLLIAGTTGSGKSVALNTMILSLLYRMPPRSAA